MQMIEVSIFILCLVNIPFFENSSFKYLPNYPSLKRDIFDLVFIWPLHVKMGQ